MGETARRHTSKPADNITDYGKCCGNRRTREGYRMGSHLEGQGQDFECRHEAGRRNSIRAEAKASAKVAKVEKS